MPARPTTRRWPTRGRAARCHGATTRARARRRTARARRRAAARATSSSTATDHARVTSAARRNARGAGTPAACSAMPRVSGPVTWTFTRTGRFSRGRSDVEEREEPGVRTGRPKSQSGAASESLHHREADRRPPTLTSGSAPSHWASMPSRGSGAGSWGAAGSSGRQRSTSSAAATGSSCGRLPIPVATPGTSTGARRVGDMGSYSTIGRRRALQAGAREVNGVNLPRPLFLWLLRVAWVTLPLTAGPAAAAATAIVGRRAARRGRDAAVARVGGRTPRDARAASRRRSTALRVDRAGAASSPRSSPRSTEHRRRSRRSARRRGDDRVLDARRRATTSRPPPRTRSHTATSNASRCAFRRRCSSARCPGARAPRRGRGRGAGAAPGRRSRSSSASSRSLVGAALVAVLSRSLDVAVAPLGGARAGRVRRRRPDDPGRPRPLPARARARRSRPNPPPRHRRRSSTSASAPVRARCRPGSTRPIDLVRAARGRRGGETVDDRGDPVSRSARRDEMLRLAAARRLPVRVTGQVAIPPPTSASPS